ncbi:MAG TPA: alpha/beta hydrolase [Steroidobacteraceae bacterium]|nr:alpha/beta hydrolase [Steroidobacteraceae bacterium]
MTTYSTAGFERLELSIAGVRTVAYAAGSGPDLVYFHGGGTFHGFDFARDWTAHFRVLLPYHPGFGESADAPAIESLGGYVSHYLALFDALALTSFHLAGASLGGRLAAEFAVLRPERVRRLVLVAPGGITTPAFPQPDFSRIAYHEWPAYFTHDPEVVRPYWPNKPDAEFLAARGREAQAVGRIALSEGLDASRLARIRAPTLLIWGKEDRMVPAGNAPQWQVRIPGSTVRIIDRAGHLLLDESPAARAALAEFLKDAGNHEL